MKFLKKLTDFEKTGVGSLGVDDYLYLSETSIQTHDTETKENHLSNKIGILVKATELYSD